MKKEEILTGTKRVLSPGVVFDKNAKEAEQAEINEKKALFKANGGKIEKLPNWIPRESDRLTKKKKETAKQELVRKVSACLGYSREAFVYLKQGKMYCSQKVIKSGVMVFIGRFTKVSQAKKFEI